VTASLTRRQFLRGAGAGAGVASSSLVFPTDDEIAKLHTYRELTTDEEASTWDDTFRSIYQS